MPSPYSQGPHAHAVHDAGGKLIDVPFPSRGKWNAMLAAYAPGCGSPVRVPGTNDGFARCGGRVGTEKVFCDYCQPKVESAAADIVNNLLENDPDDPKSFINNFVDKDLGVTFLIRKSGQGNVHADPPFDRDYIVYSNDKTGGTRTWEGYLRSRGVPQEKWQAFPKRIAPTPLDELFEHAEQAAYAIYRRNRVVPDPR